MIYLRYFLELSEAEMSEALGIAPGTVKSRLHRAAKRLQDIIAEEYPDLWEAFGGAPSLPEGQGSRVESGGAYE